jgi:hypothetical protein
MAFRILQPFISMSQGPILINKGAGLTYGSKSWMGAAIKAGRNRYWFLLMIANDSVLAQVLTVSMSALFERKAHNVVQQVSFRNTPELRQTPLIAKLDEELKTSGSSVVSEVPSEPYLDVSKNWLYSAAIEHSFNGSKLPWTSDGWSFLPVDLSTAANSSKTSPMDHDLNNVAISSVNLTISVPAIRARLDCTSIPEIGNVSTWINLQDFPSEDSTLSPDYAILNRTEKTELYNLPRDILATTSSQTYVLSAVSKVTCCSNGSLADPQ